MIDLKTYYNNEKLRDELIVTNIDCGLILYHFVKYDNQIKSDFIKKVKDFIIKYFLDDKDSYKLTQLNEDIKALCREYNVISLKIERGDFLLDKKF